MITVEYRIPSYGMFYFEELQKIEDMNLINRYTRLKGWPNVCGVEYRFIDELGNDITPVNIKK